MRRVVAIVGATATGKSALALELALALRGEIVNADSLQVYRGLDIGTGKPTPQERARVPHHLIDVLDPAEPYSAGEFARRAEAAIAEIAGRGRVAILVGGSGLYLRALLEGLSPLPPPDAALRRRLRQRLAEEGAPRLHAELVRRDPETAARLAAGDSQRVVRALEVALGTGTPLSAWQERQPFGARRLPALRVGLTLPRPVLYDRIARRVGCMRDRGWVAEVEQLLQGGVAPEVPAFQAIGYRQIVRHLRGEWSVERAFAETLRATRRFAKRQETWFRREPDVAWLDATDPGVLAGRARGLLGALAPSALPDAADLGRSDDQT
jgi:tRNA dimethylallyltransferase